MMFDVSDMLWVFYTLMHHDLQPTKDESLMEDEVNDPMASTKLTAALDWSPSCPPFINSTPSNLTVPTLILSLTESYILYT